MFSVFRPLRPSSSVDRACACRVSSRTSPQAVLCRGTALEVWNAPTGEAASAALQAGGGGGGLELAWSFEMGASARGLVGLGGLGGFAEPGLEALAVALDEGKVSVVVFDGERPGALRTVFLVDWAAPGAGLGGAGTVMPARGVFGEGATLVLDGRGRAMAMLVHAAYVVVMPFKDWALASAVAAPAGGEGLEEEDQGAVPANPAAAAALLRKRGKMLPAPHPSLDPCYALPLPRFGIPEHSVIDMCFLEGDNPSPLLAILYSAPTRSWAGRVAVARHTCALAVVALVPENPLGGCTVVWSMANLPSDSHMLIPVPREPHVLVVSTNAVQYVVTLGTQRVWCMAVNGFAHVSLPSVLPLHDLHGRKVDVAAALHAENAMNGDGTLASVVSAVGDSTSTSFTPVDVAITLDGSRFVWVDDRVVLLSLQQGVLFEVSLDRPQALRGRIVGAGGPFSCVCRFRETNRVLWGSRQADSWLMRVSAQQQQQQQHGDYHGKKRARVDDDPEERELYASWNDSDFSQRAPDMKYEVEDVLRGGAPLVDFDFAEGLPTNAAGDLENPDEEDAKTKKEAEEQANELRKLGQFSKAASRLSNAQNIIAERRKARANAQVPRDLDLVGCGTTSRLGGALSVFQSGLRSDLRAEVTLHECSGLWVLDLPHGRKVLVMSEAASSRVFVQAGTPAGTTWEERLTDEILALDEPTLYCFAFFEEANVARIVQVTPTRIRHAALGRKPPPQQQHHQQLTATPSGAATTINAAVVSTILFSPNQSVSSVTHERDTLAVVMADGAVGIWSFGETLAADESNDMNDESVWYMEFRLSQSLSARRPPEGSLDGVACVSLFSGPRRQMMVAAVRAGISEPGAGLVEIHELRQDRKAEFHFSSSFPLPLGVPVLSNAPAEALGTASRGVLANSRVLDLCVSYVGDTNKLLLTAALADGDLLVYCRNSEDDRWTRVEHGVLTRGLRGRAARPRKFAQPVNARHFRSNLLFRVRLGGGARNGIFFIGQRPCWVCSYRGRVSVVPHASTVSALLQVPLAPPSLHSGMLAEFVGGSGDHGEDAVAAAGVGEDAATSSSAAAVLASKTACPTPLDVYKVRGAIQAFAGLDGGGFVYALRAPEPRNLPTATAAAATAATTTVGGPFMPPFGGLPGRGFPMTIPYAANPAVAAAQAAAAQQQATTAAPPAVLKLTALRFCAFSGEREAGGPEGLDSVIPMLRRKLPVGGWGATRVCFLPHASRGGPDEMVLGVHAPTFAVVSQRDALESVGVDKAKVAAAIKSDRIDDVRGSLYQQEDEDEAEEAAATYQVEELQPVLALGGAPPVVEVRQAIQVVRAPDTTRVLSSFELLPDERVMCMAVMNLDVPADDVLNMPPMLRNRIPMSAMSRQQRKGLLVVGTGCVSSRGEDQDSRARLLVFEVDHAKDGSMSEQELQHTRRALARPATVPLLTLVASVTQRGPIAAVAQLEGKVLASTGNIPCSVKLLDLNPREGRLVPVGFYDAPTCVVGITVIKDQFVLLADLNRGVHFVRWRERQFNPLAKSAEPMKIFSSEFLVDGKRLAMVASDEDSTTLRMWNFTADHKNLEACGELVVGDRISKMKARKVPLLPPVLTSVGGGGGEGIPPQVLQPQQLRNKALAEDTRWSINFVTLTGSVGFVVPIDEKVFRRLDLLQAAMVASPLVPKPAGVNPAAQGAVVLPERLQRKRKAHIIDGRVVWRFVNLERTAQRKVALSVGSTVDTLLDTLLELDLLGGW